MNLNVNTASPGPTTDSTKPCGAVVEGGIADWSGVHLRGLGTGPGLAAAGYAGFSLAMTVGRLIADPLIQQATLDDIVEAIEHVVNIAGEDQVGIGTDFTQGYGDEFFRYISHDKGYGRKLTDFGQIIMPADFCRLEQFPNLTAALEKKGWPTQRIRKIMGESWIRFLGSVWVE